MARAALCCLLVCLTAGSSSTAAEIRVAPAASPVATPLRDAIARAASGDTVIVEPGVYRERVKIDKPLTLRGTAGAILDGGAAFEGQWIEAGAELPGVFTATAERQPYGLLAGGKFVAELRFSRVQEKGDWNWQTLLTKGPPLSGFSQIRALWLYHPKEKRIYARFENGAAPAAGDLIFVPSREPLLTIDGTKDVTVEGLSFANGYQAIVITKSSACLIRQCRITSFEQSGIVLAAGASDCQITECEITRNSLEEWTPSLQHDRSNYEIWQVHKDAGNYDRNGINLIRAGKGNRILNNRIDRVFDGIALGDYAAESLDIPLPDENHCRATEIAGNVISNTRDSGIELGVGCIEVNVHHNVLRQTHGGLRFKLPRIGPVFIHHNRFIDNAPFSIWFSMDASPAEGYVYHNTILRGSSEALLISRDSMQRKTFVAPKWHFVNNLIINERGFCKPSNEVTLDFTTAHNVVTGKMRPWPKDAAKDTGSVYAVEIEHGEDGRPQPGSPAIDAGLDLTTYWNGKPLPGCEPGYFHGKAPDTGADERKP